MRFNLQFEILSDFTYLPFLTQIFKRLKVPKALVLTQILVEAYNNAVIHGNKKKKEKWVGVEISLTKRRAKIRVLDRGAGIKDYRLETADRRLKTWRSSGRGLKIIRALAKHVTSRKQRGKHIFEATV